MKLAVYVPQADLGSVLPRSAIVGTPLTKIGGLNDLVTVDYEGNRYGVPQLDSYRAKLRQAAGRHVVRYPTVARMTVPVKSLILVGWYDPETEQLDVTEPELLDEWTGPR